MIAQTQKTILQNDATSCTILGIQYDHNFLDREVSIELTGFAIEISGNMMTFKFAITIAATRITAPLLASPAYI